MNFKLLFFTTFFTILFNFFIMAKSDNILYDPREIIIKPKAKNGLLLFKIKYWGNDFIMLVKKSFLNGTADPKLKRLDINEKNILNQLERIKAIGCGPGGGYIGISYNELVSATIKNLDSKQEFLVLISPIMRRAFIPGITVGKYKFKKITLTMFLGSLGFYQSDIFIDSELPGFTIDSNTAYIYGLIDLSKGEIKQYYHEKTMEKLRKYVQNLKKFKTYENMKVVELNPENESTDNLLNNEGEKK